MVHSWSGRRNFKTSIEHIHRNSSGVAVIQMEYMALDVAAMKSSHHWCCHRIVIRRGEVNEGANTHFDQTEYPRTGNFRIPVAGILAGEKHSGFNGVVLRNQFCWR